MSAALTNCAADILERLIDPYTPGLSQQAASELLELSFPPDDVRRMNELAEKARQGTLSPEESQEIEEYERVGHLLGILQSKARLSLTSRNATD